VHILKILQILKIPAHSRADALALVRKQLWAQEEIFHESPWETDTVKSRGPLWND